MRDKGKKLFKRRKKFFGSKIFLYGSKKFLFSGKKNRPERYYWNRRHKHKDFRTISNRSETEM